MSWSIIIPTSMLVLGAWLLLISFPLQWITPENSKASLWLALIGGFGVGGGAGGLIGQWLVNVGNQISGTTASLTQQAVGASFGVLLFAVGAILFWKSAGKGGNGMKGGKSKKDKLKQTAYLFGAAVLGCAIAGLPHLYGWANTAVAWTGGQLISILPG